MRFAFRYPAHAALLRGVALLAGALLGCSVDGSEASPATQPANGVSGPDADIVFDDDATLALAPGATQLLRVTGSPPASYEVSFTLLGDALDATLDRTTVVADKGGHATVQLRAPSASTTFRVRASIKDGPSAEVAVAVSDKGFGTLRVLPVYGGKRPITGWVASAVAHTTCAELAPILPGEAPGALKQDAGAKQLPVVVENAPVGPSLAVAIRAGHYIWGCVDETHLAANDSLDVKVPVTDKPMDVGDTHLDLVFSYEPEDPGYTNLLSESTTLLLDAFMAPQPGEAASLLDAMQGLLAPDDASAFSSQRSAGNWEGVTAQQLAQSGQTLRDAVEAWALLGLGQQNLGLRGHLASIGAEGHASLTLDTLGVLDAASAGVPDWHLMSWAADPDDTVHLGGTVYWLPTHYIGGAARAGAMQALPSLPAGATIPEALDQVLDCAGLATTLGGFGACDTACLTQLCRDALSDRWQTALAASANSDLVGEISVNASGDGKVNDTAAPVLFEGVWLGEVTDGITVAPVEGKASGYSSIPQDPPPQ